MVIEYKVYACNEEIEMSPFRLITPVFFPVRIKKEQKAKHFLIMKLAVEVVQ